MPKRPLSHAKLRTIPAQCSWVDQRLVREHSIDQLSHAACALSLFLVTVADAKGLSFYSAPTLCRRLSIPPGAIHAARQELVAHELLACDNPLYQVLALEVQGREETADPALHDDTVDIKAVFARIWEA